MRLDAEREVPEHLLPEPVAQTDLLEPNHAALRLTLLDLTLLDRASAAVPARAVARQGCTIRFLLQEPARPGTRLNTAVPGFSTPASDPKRPPVWFPDH